MASKKNTNEKTKPTVKKATTTKKVETTVAAVIKPVKKDSAKQTVKVDVYGLDGKVTGSVSLPGEIFAAKINPTLMAQAVRVYLANQRQGNASTKTRGEVTGSTRKIYRQKGTGRARHGAMRAPIFVHGGVAHGPRPHDFSLSLPQKMKQAALFSALSSKVIDGEVRVVAGFTGIEPKTKVVANVLKQLQLNGKKTLLVVSEKRDGVVRAARNIEGVTYINAHQLSTYDVLQHKTVLIMQEAVAIVEKTFGRKAQTP